MSVADYIETHLSKQDKTKKFRTDHNNASAIGNDGCTNASAIGNDGCHNASAMGNDRCPNTSAIGNEPSFLHDIDLKPKACNVRIEKISIDEDMIRSYKDSKNRDQSDSRSDEATSPGFGPKNAGFMILKDDPNCITRYSDSKVEYSVYVCHECNFRGRIEALKYHIRVKHNKEIKEYISKHQCFKMVEKILHSCKICGETFHCNSSAFVHSHLSKHKISLKDYEQKYLNDNISTKRVGKGRYSNTPNDYSVFGCHECEFSGNYHQLQEHVLRFHAMAMKKYKAKHGKNIIKDNVFHSCKICNIDIFYTNVNLSRHVQLHNMKPEEYINQMLSSKVPVPVSVPGPVPRKVEDSVREEDYVQTYLCEDKHVKNDKKIKPENRKDDMKKEGHKKQKTNDHKINIITPAQVESTVAPDTELAGYPANYFSGYPVT